ncbi:MAG: hypothetical protein ACLT98_11630 [Eggerthellaceae bacterium]
MPVVSGKPPFFADMMIMGGSNERIIHYFMMFVFILFSMLHITWRTSGLAYGCSSAPTAAV